MAFSTLLFTSLFFQLPAFSFQPSAVYAQGTSDEAAAPSTELSGPAGEPAVPGAGASGTEDKAGGSEAEPVVPEAEPEGSTLATEVPIAEPVVSSPEPIVPEPESVDPGPLPELSGVEPNSEPPGPSDELALPEAEPAIPHPGPVAPSAVGVAPNIEPPTLTPEPAVSSAEIGVPNIGAASASPQPAVPSLTTPVSSSQPPAIGLTTPGPQLESQIKLGRLSFGFVTSFYQPELSTLNGIFSNRQVAILADPNYLLPGNPAFRVEARNIVVEDLGANPWFGMEAQWEFSPTFALRFSGGVWRGEGLASDTIVTFLRSNLPQIEVPRSARYNLLLDQFFLDWRYYFLNDPRRGRVSLDLGILGVSVGFFTLDSVMKVVHPAAPRGGFAAVSSTEAMGISFITRYGLTGEYFLSNKLALGFSGHYLVGRMNKLEISRHFSAGFPQVPIPEPLSIRAGVPLPTTPPTPNEGESLRYATTITDQRGTENIGPQQNLILELDGPEVSGYVRFYF